MEIIKYIVIALFLWLMGKLVWKRIKKNDKPKNEAVSKYKANEEVSQKAQYFFRQKIAEYQNTDATLDEVAEAKLFAEAVEIQLLKSPATAQFCDLDEMTVAKDNGAYIVSGYVDSQNSYGAMIRTPYKITVFKEAGIWKNANKFVSTSAKFGTSVIALTLLYLLGGIIIAGLLFFLISQIIM